MPRNKPRLQLALYARPKYPGSYHYALFVAPKNMLGPITKYHVKNTLQVDSAGQATQPWHYERRVVPDVDAEQRLLVRVIIAKVVKSDDQVQQTLEAVPVHQIDSMDHQAQNLSFSCQTWVRDAFEELKTQGVIATYGLGQWEDVQQKALEYINGKRQQNRWSSTWKGGSNVPLMDLFESRELIE